MSDYIENADDFDSTLRLGDVIEGFSYILPKFDDFFNNKNDFQLEIKPEQFFVVLTPCCSIEEKMITVVPLKKVLFSFFRNPHYSEDLTRINRPVTAEKSVPVEAWESYSPEKKEYLSKGIPQFVFLEKFIYQSNTKLPTYELKQKQAVPIASDHYMIDFKDAFTVYSNKIQRGSSYPKVLQLTIRTRTELRDKLAYFFSRIPNEDVV